MSTHNKMDPEVKAKWTAALRTGDFPQATNYLYKDGGFCCLGVLCEVMLVPHNREMATIDVLDKDGSFFQRKVSVRNYIFTNDEGRTQITDTEPPLNYQGLSGMTMGHLVQMNDAENKSFSEIADWIEANL